MKKKLIALVFLAAAMSTAAPSWAVFQSLGRSTFNAVATTGGVQTTTATIVMRLVSDPLNPAINYTALAWPSGIDPTTQSWVRSDRLLLVVATITHAGGGIQIYTRNTESDANPKFVDPTPSDKTNTDSFAGGLLRVGAPTTTAPPLPLAWSIKASSFTIPNAVDPNAGLAVPESFAWLLFKDRYNDQAITALNYTAFLDGQDFITMMNVVGIHGAQGDGQFFAHPDGARAFVYFEANFAGAAAAQSYQTSTVTVETYIQ